MASLLSPVIAIHLAAAVTATAIGPIALWARLGSQMRPRLHRASGYAWVTLMLATAVSALFISAEAGPQWHGFGFIHLLVPFTLGMLALAFFYLAQRNFAGHKSVMQRLYIGFCVVAGGFTLLPNRLLGHWLWSTLGVL